MWKTLVHPEEQECGLIGLVTVPYLPHDKTALSPESIKTCVYVLYLRRVSTHCTKTSGQRLHIRTQRETLNYKLTAFVAFKTFFFLLFLTRLLSVLSLRRQTFCSVTRQPPIQ